MKKYLFLLLTCVVLTCSVAFATEQEDGTVTESTIIETTQSESSEPEDGEQAADEEPVIIVTYPEEEVENGFVKPFSEYTPTDIFTFLIFLIKVFENVIKLFIHKWGFSNW